MSSVTETARDGRVLAETRWASLVVFAILVPAVVVLWGLPGETLVMRQGGHGLAKFLNATLVAHD